MSGLTPGAPKNGPSNEIDVHPSAELTTAAAAAPLTLEQFVEFVRRSGLVDALQLDPLLAKFQQQSLDDGHQAVRFSELLVETRLLTPWQVRKLMKSQFKGFFIDRYRLMSYLGRGGMGVVFRAEHTRMHRPVALKILPQHFVEDAERLRLFYHESEATAALDHPNVVRAYDVNNSGSQYYLVMEFVDGPTLQQLIDQRGPLAFETAADYVRQAADGLAHAHERGIIHRDIKPANLMLDAHGRIKILDMGLAHWTSGHASPLDPKHNVVGSPEYMSPEQALDSTTVDSRADIYSLGCTFYFLLTGAAPFGGDSTLEVLLKHQRDDPLNIEEARPGIPRELTEICRRMMARQPADRFATALEVRKALADWLARSAASAHPARRAPETVSRDPAGTAGYKILVADDDSLTRQMLDRQLQKHGYRVVLARDGQEAIEALDEDVAVCLFDLKMPRADGLQCLRHVREHYPDTPTIIISGAGEIRDAVAAMREGAYDYFTKPCKVGTVMVRVEEAITSRRQRVAERLALEAVMKNHSLPGPGGRCGGR